jgi:ABC-2 type transport system permease protein
MFALYLKELRSFLSSITGYVVITVFLVTIGLFLWFFPNEFNVLDYGYANLDGLFVVAPIVFLFLVPAVTMRMFSEEKKSGTIELLLTRPLSDIQIVTAKFLAAVTLIVFALVPTLVYVFSISKLGFPPGNLDYGSIWGSYIGLLFLGSTFASIGVFASSLSDNQVISFIIAIVLSAFSYLGFEFLYSINIFGNLDLFIRSLGISSHYSSISRGVMDTRDVIYFLSVILLFLYLTNFSLSKRKW